MNDPKSPENIETGGGRIERVLRCTICGQAVSPSFWAPVGGWRVSAAIWCKSCQRKERQLPGSGGLSLIRKLFQFHSAGEPANADQMAILVAGWMISQTISDEMARLVGQVERDEETTDSDE